MVDAANRCVLGATDVAIILGSILLIVLVGIAVSRNQDKTARGYFLASGKLPWYIIGAAFVSTSVSSEQIVGTVGAAYKSGMGIANWEWWTLPTYSLLLVFFIPLYLSNRITTVPELLAKRFGPLCADIYSWVMLVAYVAVFMVTALYGGSLAFSQLTGWGFYQILWITTILVGLYAVKGGLRSVMITDALQCLLLVAGGVTLFFVALHKIPGGWAAMQHANPARFHLYHAPSDPVAPFPVLFLGSIGVFLFYQSSNQVMVQRILGARSTWDGMMGIVFAGFINLLRPLVTCFLGLIAYHWIFVMHAAPALKNPDSTFAFALTHFAPGWGLRGIILAGFVAAVMSTTSALANSSATIFSLDVYKRLIDKDASERRLITVGSIASALSLVIAACLAPIVSRMGIFTFFQTGITFIATPFISVMILGILWKRANYEGALFGLIGGSAIMFTLGFGIAPHWFPRLHWIYVAAIAEALTMFGIVIVSLLTPPPNGEQCKPFIWHKGLLSAYDEGIRRPWYQSLKLWFGIYAVVWVYLYSRFW